jgi:hypothetical protein
VQASPHGFIKDFDSRREEARGGWQRRHAHLRQTRQPDLARVFFEALVLPEDAPGIVVGRTST